MRTILAFLLMFLIGCGATVSQLQSEPVTPPQIITQVAPLYPQEAIDNGLTGTVILKFLVNKHGNTQEIKVVSGPKLFRLPAINCVKKWKYKPAQQNGKNIEVRITQPVTFIATK